MRDEKGRWAQRVSNKRRRNRPCPYLSERREMAVRHGGGAEQQTRGERRSEFGADIFNISGKMKKATSQNDVAVFFSVTYYTLCTLLERRQLVHTYMCFGVPFTRTFTLFTLGFQVLLDLLWEWETLIPKFTPFPQTSHLAILLHLPWISFCYALHYSRNRTALQG